MTTQARHFKGAGLVVWFNAGAKARFEAQRREQALAAVPGMPRPIDRQVRRGVRPVRSQGDGRQPLALLRHWRLSAFRRFLVAS